MSLLHTVIMWSSRQPGRSPTANTDSRKFSSGSCSALPQQARVWQFRRSPRFIHVLQSRTARSSSVTVTVPCCQWSEEKYCKISIIARLAAPYYRGSSHFRHWISSKFYVFPSLQTITPRTSAKGSLTLLYPIALQYSNMYSVSCSGS